MSNSTNLSGAYSTYSCNISDSAKAAFSEAIKEILGVSYSPVAVSQQVVAGTNYKFFCNAKVSTMHPVNGAAIVSIYSPLEGKAHVTGIQAIH